MLCCVLFNLARAEAPSHVHDEAQVFSPDFRLELEASLEQHQQRTGARLGVFFFQSLQGSLVQSFLQQEEEKGPAAVLVVDLAKRSVFVWPNSLARESWPKNKTREIIWAITPLLKKGDYPQATTTATREMAHALGSEMEPLSGPAKTLPTLPAAIVGLALLLTLLGRGQNFRPAWQRYPNEKASAPLPIFTAKWKGRAKSTFNPKPLEERAKDTRLIILSRSHFYPVAHFRLSLMLGLGVPLLLGLGAEWMPLPFSPLESALPALLAGFVLGFRAKLKKMFSTTAELDDRVGQQVLRFAHNTPRPFLLVSILEKRMALGLTNEQLAATTPVQCRLLLKQAAATVAKEGLEAGLLYAALEVEKLLAKSAPLSHTSSDQAGDSPTAEKSREWAKTQDKCSKAGKKASASPSKSTRLK